MKYTSSSSSAWEDADVEYDELAVNPRAKRRCEQTYSVVAVEELAERSGAYILGHRWLMKWQSDLLPIFSQTLSYRIVRDLLWVCGKRCTISMLYPPVGSSSGASPCGSQFDVRNCKKVTRKSWQAKLSEKQTPRGVHQDGAWCLRGV